MRSVTTINAFYAILFIAAKNTDAVVHFEAILINCPGPGACNHCSSHVLITYNGGAIAHWWTVKILQEIVIKNFAVEFYIFIPIFTLKNM